MHIFIYTYVLSSFVALSGLNAGLLTLSAAAVGKVDISVIRNTKIYFENANELCEINACIFVLQRKHV